MILRVEFDQFPQTVKRMLDGAHAYVSPQGKSALITAGDPKTGLIVVAPAAMSAEEAGMKLQEQGVETFEGLWSLDGSGLTGVGFAGNAYVAAVAYASDGPQPGLWMDAYGEEPTLAQVMRTMYDEFIANGEVPEDTSLEEFIRLANPNVVILSPEQVGGYVEAKTDC